MLSEDFIRPYIDLLTQDVGVREIPDGSDFQAEMEKAIAAGQTVKFWYRNRYGNTNSLVFKPQRTRLMDRRRAVDGRFPNSSKLVSLYIGQMGRPPRMPVDRSYTPQMRQSLQNLPALLQEKPEMAGWRFVPDRRKTRQLCDNYGVKGLVFRPEGWDPAGGRILFLMHGVNRRKIAQYQAGYLRIGRTYEDSPGEPVGHIWGYPQPDGGVKIAGLDTRQTKSGTVTFEVESDN